MSGADALAGATRQGSAAVWRREVPDEASVCALARQFAALARPPLVLYLRGDLGAGKTTFARACIHALGYAGYVKSPSYGLLETYRVGNWTILHLDLYRIEDPEELEYLAVRDLFDEASMLLVEWPDRGAGHLPEPDLVLDFGEIAGKRCIQCASVSNPGRQLAAAVAGRSVQTNSS